MAATLFGSPVWITRLVGPVPPLDRFGTFEVKKPTFSVRTGLVFQRIVTHIGMQEAAIPSTAPDLTVPVLSEFWADLRMGKSAVRLVFALPIHVESAGFGFRPVHF